MQSFIYKHFHNAPFPDSSLFRVTLTTGSYNLTIRDAVNAVLHLLQSRQSCQVGLQLQLDYKYNQFYNLTSQNSSSFKLTFISTSSPVETAFTADHHLYNITKRDCSYCGTTFATIYTLLQRYESGLQLLLVYIYKQFYNISNWN